ncbi:MAG: TfoX/Sxy family DNA transformation protein [Oceanospirillaceae bacterium]|nr:TfoX/Sxy family DNA transformation protein [Oceanospirillaceae bacterium]
MENSYPKKIQRLRDLNGFGPKSEDIFAQIGIYSVDEFMQADPYQLYKRLLPIKGIGMNSIYAMIGARENISWLDVARDRKTEILMTLDDMGLAPKKKKAKKKLVMK